MTADLVIVKVDRARQLLAEAKSAPAAKRVADLARAAEVYARRQRLSDEAISHATAIKVDAMALAGELMREAPKNPGTRGEGRPRKGGGKLNPPKQKPPTLGQQGIPPGQAKEFRTADRLKRELPDVFEQVRTGKRKLSQARAELRRKDKRADLKAKAAAASPAPAEARVVCGDALKELPRLKDCPRLIFADPPYNLGVDYGQGAKADRLPPAKFLAWVERWVKLSARALAPDGSFWLLMADEYAAECCLIGKRHLTLRSWVVWYETFGVNCADKFNRCKRHLFYFVKDPARVVWHPDAVARESARRVLYNDGRAAPGGKLWDDVWTIPRLAGTAAERWPDFPTQLPLALLRPVVAVASDPGDLVVDPFSGSATTGVVCLELGRRYLGVERSRKFADLSRARLRGATV